EGDAGGDLAATAQVVPDEEVAEADEHRHLRDPEVIAEEFDVKDQAEEQDPPLPVQLQLAGEKDELQGEERDLDAAEEAPEIFQLEEGERQGIEGARRRMA